MKILYLTPGCFDKGGISRYNRFQIQAIREIVGDSNVRVYSLRAKKQGDFEEPFSVSWAARTDFHFVNKVEFAARVALEALGWRPEIIWAAHVHMSWLALMVGKLINAKVVMNAYGLELWSGLSRFMKMGLRGANEVISDCFFSARYLEQNGFRPHGSVRVIWDTVDVARFYPAEPSMGVLEKYDIPFPSSNVNLLTLGRMVSGADHKGYRRLLEAFSVAAKEVGSLHLIYAGSGDLVELLRVRARELGLSSRVHFVGSVDDKDLPDIYRSAHIFSLVSDRGQGRGEGLPAVVLEAAACGIPILVGNQDGSSEAVADGIDGYVLDSFDIASHARAIVRLATDPALRRKMGAAASRKVCGEFSYPKFLHKHQIFFSSFLVEGL